MDGDCPWPWCLLHQQYWVSINTMRSPFTVMDHVLWYLSKLYSSLLIRNNVVFLKKRKKRKSHDWQPFEISLPEIKHGIKHVQNWKSSNKIFYRLLRQNNSFEASWKSHILLRDMLYERNLKIINLILFDAVQMYIRSVIYKTSQTHGELYVSP